jgi:opioid growth factor receptor-like protein
MPGHPTTNCPLSPILAYYRGDGRDAAGRYRHEVLRFSTSQLEAVHDYIQWLFPLPEPSQYNQLAPVLTQTDIAAFNEDLDLRARLRESFGVMLAFYGMELAPQPDPPSVRSATAFAHRRSAWISLYDHNYLRITRILRSLSLLGLKAEAIAFLGCLEKLYEVHGAAIGPVTLEYWRDAIVV